MMVVGHTNCYQHICLLPSATKLGQGNIFRSVCQEFCPRGGGVSPHCMLGYTPPGPEAGTPWEQIPPSAVHAGRYRHVRTSSFEPHFTDFTGKVLNLLESGVWPSTEGPSCLEIHLCVLVACYSKND